MTYHREAALYIVERLALRHRKTDTSDKITLTVERLPDGKMRVTSNSWVMRGCYHAIRCLRSDGSTAPCKSPEKRETRTNGTSRPRLMTQTSRGFYALRQFPARPASVFGPVDKPPWKQSVATHLIFRLLILILRSNIWCRSSRACSSLAIEA